MNFHISLFIILISFTHYNIHLYFSFVSNYIRLNAPQGQEDSIGHCRIWNTRMVSDTTPMHWTNALDLLNYMSAEFEMGEWMV